MIKDIVSHHTLSDAEIDGATLKELREAYRTLLAHHIAETAALLSRRDDLTRRRDDQLAKSQKILADSQKLIERANEIIRRDEEIIDQLGTENARLHQIIDDLKDKKS